MIMWHYSNITGFKDRSAYTDFNTKAWQLFVNEFCSMKSLYGTIAYLFFSCHFLFISFLFCPLVILIESTFSCQKMLKLTHNTLVLIVLLLKTLNLHFMLPSFLFLQTGFQHPISSTCIEVPWNWPNTFALLYFY